MYGGLRDGVYVKAAVPDARDELAKDLSEESRAMEKAGKVRIKKRPN